MTMIHFSRAAVKILLLACGKSASNTVVYFIFYNLTHCIKEFIKAATHHCLFTSLIAACCQTAFLQSGLILMFKDLFKSGVVSSLSFYQGSAVQ